MASFLDTLFSGGAQEDAAAKNAQALSQYQGTANTALGTGYNTGTTNLNSAIGAYSPLAALGQNYNKAGNLYLGALGANGPQGTADAQAAFTNAPGYSGAIDAGLSAIDRQRASQGMANSGNANLDAQTFGQNLQNQQYNTWLSNLQSAGNTGATATANAAQGQAAGYTGLGTLGYQYGQDQGNIANNVASGTMADNNMVAAGQAAGAKNLLGAGLSLATLGMGGNPFGGSLTGGGSGSSGGFGNSLFGQAYSGLQNMNLGQRLFGGGTPSGY